MQFGSHQFRPAASTRSRLILLVIAILLPIAVFAVVLLWQFSRTENARVRVEGEALAGRLSDTVDRQLEGAIAALETLASSPTLQPGGDLAAFDARAHAVLQRRGNFVVVRDRSGQQIINTGLPFGSPLPVAQDPVLLAADRLVFETGKPAVSDLYFGTTSHLPLLLVEVPVFRDGAVTYALSIAIDPRQLAATIAAATPPDWTAAVVDRTGKIIARSRHQDRYAGRQATEDLVRETAGQHGTWEGTTLDAAKVLGAYVRSPISGWRVAVGVPLDVIQAPLARLTAVLVTSSLLVLALSAALAARVARALSRPILQLTTAATRLGRGEPVPVLQTGLLEVDEVARALAAAQAEIVRRETDLQASEQRFKAAVRAVAGVLWTNDASGRMFGDQPGWTALTGQTQAEYEGYGWAARVHPGDAQPTIDAWEEAVRGRKTFMFEHRLRCRDGAYRRFSIRAVPVLDEHGMVTEWVGVHTDITDEYEAKASLAESQARLRAVFEAVPVGVVIAQGPDGKIVEGNAQTQRILGHSTLEPANIESYGLWRAFHADGRRVAAADYPLARVIRSGEERPELEVLYERDDGERFWLRLIAAPIRDDAGHRTGGVAALLDIDREKRAEADLRELNATLERRVEETVADRDRIWRISTELMLVAHFDGKIVALNPAWSTTLGWSEQDLVGTFFTDLIHPDDLERSLQEVGTLSRGLTTTRFENRYRHHDGSYRWLSWTAVPDAGLVHAIARDITSEKAAAQALQQAEEQLRQSQKMEVVGQLTGGVAHDFNNLLTVMTGHLEMARRRLEAESPNPRVARNLASALEGAHRAATLTHRLLAFSRQSALRPEVLDLNAVIGGMSDLIRQTLGETIDIEARLADDLWRVEADPNQVENAILNLCVNARDAMPEGGTLTIESANATLGEDRLAGEHGEVKPGQYVMIAVCDTGCGMSKEVRDRVFEPFFTTKPVGKGTGLGLSQVFGFLRQSGGHAEIGSELGEGTTVRMYFPRLTHVPERPHEPAELAAAPVRAGAGETILVIEDEQMVRNFTISALEEGGYRVLAAPDGPSGLALLEAHPEVALLFTDVVLTGTMNGRKVADAARALRPELRVVYTTGYTRSAIIHRGRLDEDVDVITKPFTATGLLAKVQAALRNGAG